MEKIHLFDRIQQAKTEFEKKHGLAANTVLLGKQQIREINEYVYLSNGGKFWHSEVKQYPSRWASLSICGLNLDSTLTPLGACIFKGNTELDVQKFYEEDWFQSLPENQLEVKHLIADFDWLATHSNFSRADIEALKNEL